MSRALSVVSVKWLSGQLSSPNIRILDASWHLPSAKRNPKEEYAAKHIPGSLFFDVDECVDKKSPYDHMLPSAKEFEEYVGKLGISNDTHVIVYDTNEKFGILSAPRVWWTFQVFGHKNVSVLDGGIPKWCEEKQPTTSEVTKVSPAKFTASFNASMIRQFEDIEKNITEKKFQVVDARPPGRFLGKDPEPRPGIKPGHIKGSVNIPFFKIMDPDKKVIKDKESLGKVFTEAGVTLQKPVVASCGSGMSACCLVFAAHLYGADDMPVYDGAWCEWFQRAKPELKEDCPKE